MSSIFTNPNPFGAQHATSSNPFGGLNATASQPAQGSNLFGQSQNQTGGGFLGANEQTQQRPLFGASQPQPQQTSFFGQSTQQQQPPANNLFGAKASTNPFGGFGGSTMQQTQQQQQQNLFGQTAQQQQQQQAQQAQLQTQLQASQPPRLASSIWQPNSGVNALNRTIEGQMEMIANKWQPAHPQTAFQTYLYNFVGESDAPFYAPKPGEDMNKWEAALQKRPAPGYIPVLARGFYDLGERLKRQTDYLHVLRSRLHEINASLKAMLENHDLVLSVRAAECRRRHMVLSQRCLALATKAQVLKNRGFGMDNVEEDLKLKLEKLERAVFDPMLKGRAEEIWARMLAIRERSRTLQIMMERAGQTVANGDSVEVDEAAINFAKKQLEMYAEQLQHLSKELGLIRTAFEEWEAAQKNPTAAVSRRERLMIEV